MRSSTEHTESSRAFVGGALVAGVAGVAAAVLAATTIMTAAPNEAKARPDFSAKTGKPCQTCHTTPPKLNPTGQRFKANGYKF